MSVGIPEQHDFISVDEYIEGEQLNEVRHEYIGGQVYAMSGGSEAHNVISGNLYTAFRNRFKGHPCRVFMADMKLRLKIAEDDIFYYPDLMVTCDPADDAKFYKTRPKVIVEVLSPSTERVDRREKFLSYQRLSSLEDYVLVDQETIRLTVFRRVNDWKPEHLGPDELLRLPSVDFEQSVAAIYEDVSESLARK